MLTCIDYCNSLYGVLNESQLQKLQRVQNVAVRFVFGAKRHPPTSGLLKELHWLPVKQRILFKMGCLMFKIVWWHCPAYLARLFEKNSRETRRNYENLLRLPKSLNAANRNSFSYRGAKTWNTLPCYLRQETDYVTFKKDLKTFLFCQSF